MHFVMFVHGPHEVRRADLPQVDAVVDDDPVAESGVDETRDVLPAHCVMTYGTDRICIRHDSYMRASTLDAHGNVKENRPDSCLRARVRTVAKQLAHHDVQY